MSSSTTSRPQPAAWAALGAMCGAQHDDLPDVIFTHHPEQPESARTPPGMNESPFTIEVNPTLGVASCLASFGRFPRARPVALRSAGRGVDQLLVLLLDHAPLTLSSAQLAGVDRELAREQAHS